MWKKVCRRQQRQCMNQYKNIKSPPVNRGDLITWCINQINHRLIGEFNDGSVQAVPQMKTYSRVISPQGFLTNAQGVV